MPTHYAPAPLTVCPTCRAWFDIQHTDIPNACTSGPACDYCPDLTGRPNYRPMVTLAHTLDHLTTRHPVASFVLGFVLLVLGCAVTGS